MRRPWGFRGNWAYPTLCYYIVLRYVSKLIVTSRALAYGKFNGTFSNVVQLCTSEINQNGRHFHKTAKIESDNTWYIDLSCTPHRK